MSNPTIDISWVLEEGTIMTVTKLHDGNYRVKEVYGNRAVTLSYTNTGRLFFDGQDIETEEFMGFVGLIDEVDEVPLRVVYLENNW